MTGDEMATQGSHSQRDPAPSWETRPQDNLAALPGMKAPSAMCAAPVPDLEGQKVQKGDWQAARNPLQRSPGQVRLRGPNWQAEGPWLGL